MSTTYLVGEQTKRKIFKVSRQLFYKQGYDETTYDDISKLAKVNRALIPYYFKNKKNLALLVFQRFIEDYYAICDKTMEGLNMSDEVHTAVYMFGYYRLLKNRNLARFLIQFHSDVDYDERMVTSEKKFFDSLNPNYSKVSASDYAILSQMDYGIEKELIRIIYYKEDTDIDQLSSTEFHLILGYLGYSKEKIDEIIKDTLQHLDKCQIHVKDRFNFEIKDGSSETNEAGSQK